MAVRDRSWGTAALATVLDSHTTLGVQLPWTPTGNWQYLMMFAAGDETYRRPHNKAALALGGHQAENLRGDLLVLAITDGKAVTLRRDDLLVLCTRLLVAEAAAGELGPARP